MKARTITLSAMMIIAAAGYVYAQAQNQHSLAGFIPEITAASQRPCLFADGGWTIIDCSDSAAASSAQLNAWGRYVVQCGDDSYLAWGDAATSNDADTSDGWIPSDSWVEFMTDSTIRFLSCRNKNVDSDCRYIECE